MLVIFLIPNIYAQPSSQAKVPPTQAEVPPPQAEVPPTQAEVPPTQAEVPPTQAGVPPPQAEVTPTQAEVPPPQADVLPTQARIPLPPPLLVCGSGTVLEGGVCVPEQLGLFPIEYVIAGVVIVAIAGIAIILSRRKKAARYTKGAAIKKFCGKCGATIDPTIKFCRKCGQPIPKQVAVKNIRGV